MTRMQPSAYEQALGDGPILGGWQTVTEGTTSHVLPKDDLMPHSLKVLHFNGMLIAACWCKPQTELFEMRAELTCGIEGCAVGMIVEHNSMDGREAYETEERSLH